VRKGLEYKIYLISLQLVDWHAAGGDCFWTAEGAELLRVREGILCERHVFCAETMGAARPVVAEISARSVLLCALCVALSPNATNEKAGHLAVPGRLMNQTLEQ